MSRFRRWLQDLAPFVGEALRVGVDLLAPYLVLPGSIKEKIMTAIRGAHRRKFWDIHAVAFGTIALLGLTLLAAVWLTPVALAAQVSVTGLVGLVVLWVASGYRKARSRA